MISTNHQTLVFHVPWMFFDTSRASGECSITRVGNLVDVLFVYQGPWGLTPQVACVFLADFKSPIYFVRARWAMPGSKTLSCIMLVFQTC